MSDQTWHFIDAVGTQQGPISIPQLQTLVASGGITPETQVWTEALGEQWIPASNIEGLFTPAAEPSPALRTSVPAAVAPSPAGLQQPAPAATTPMIPSTPTTQAVIGVPVPTSLTAQQQAQAQAANPYQSPLADPLQQGGIIYPATIKKGGSLGLWIMLLFGGMLLTVLGMMSAGMLTRSLEPSAVGTALTAGLVLVGLGVICTFISGILTYVYLYRAWKCLQPGGATVSPGAAVWLIIVPVFNIYWLFKAYGGLPKQWNTITSSYPNTQSAPKLTFGAFICLLLLPLIGQVIWISQLTKGINFMAALHTQQARPAGSALAGLGSRANFQ